MKFFLTLNSYLLISWKFDFSNAENGLSVYDWNRIKGKKHNSGKGRYCLGECSLPTTQETGAFDLDISEENSQKLSLELKRQMALI